MSHQSLPARRPWLCGVLGVTLALPLLGGCGGGGGGGGGYHALRRSGTQADNCQGQATCVIFIDGVDIWPPSHWHSYPQDRNTATHWGVWKNYLDSRYYDRRSRPYTWGGAFYVARDGPAGMWWLHTILSNLATLAFTGPVTVVGHSNGAASIFLYFDHAQQGFFSGDYRISKFVAFEAPTLIPARLWARWYPYYQVPTANQYIRQHHIQGMYAWERGDPFSGPVFCVCRLELYSNAGFLAAHIALLNNPDAVNMDLLQAL